MRDPASAGAEPAMDRHDDPRPREHDEHLADQLGIPGGPRPTVWRTPAGPQPWCISPQTAQMLLDGYTRPRDIVIDVDDDIAFAAAAAATARHHHALDGHIHLATLGIGAEYIDMILVHWPRQAINPHELLLACRAVLRTAGRLVVAVRVDAAHRLAHLTAMAGAADTAGLRLVVHVAATTPAFSPATPAHANTTHTG